MLSMRMTIRGFSIAPTSGSIIFSLSSRSMARLRRKFSLLMSAEVVMSMTGTLFFMLLSNSSISSFGALATCMILRMRSSAFLRSRSSCMTRSDVPGHMLGAENSALFLPRTEKMPFSDPPLWRKMRFFHSEPSFSELMA